MVLILHKNVPFFIETRNIEEFRACASFLTHIISDYPSDIRIACKTIDNMKHSIAIESQTRSYFFIGNVRRWKSNIGITKNMPMKETIYKLEDKEKLEQKSEVPKIPKYIISNISTLLQRITLTIILCAKYFDEIHGWCGNQAWFQHVVS